MTVKFLVGAFASALLSMSVVTASASTVLSDGDFLTATASNFSSTGSPANSTTICLSCGNPGAAWNNKIVAGSTTATTTNLLVDNALIYDPSISGPITSINASYDRSLTNSLGGTSPVFFRLLAEQGSNIFVTGINLGGTQANDGSWQTLSASNIHAGAFALLSGSGSLNFAGAPITFGLEAVSSVAANSTMIANFDNINVEINPTPLPAALPLFASGAGILGYFGCRKKRKTAASTAA